MVAPCSCRFCLSAHALSFATRKPAHSVRGTHVQRNKPSQPPAVMFQGRPMRFMYIDQPFARRMPTRLRLSDKMTIDRGAYGWLVPSCQQRPLLRACQKQTRPLMVHSLRPESPPWGAAVAIEMGAAGTPRRRCAPNRFGTSGFRTCRAASSFTPCDAKANAILPIDRIFVST